MATVVQTGTLPAFALIRREFLTELRRPRAFFIIFAVGIVAVTVAAINWPADVYSLRMASFFANEFFQGIALALFGVIVICVPAMSAGAIVAERERETFDFVRMSLISSTGYVAAKLINGCGLFLTILVGLIPVLGAVFFLAGVDTAWMMGVLLMLAVTGVSVTAVSLLSSAFFRRTISAVVASYAGIAALAIAPVVLLFLLLALANFVGFSVRSFAGTLSAAFEYGSIVGSFLAALYGERSGTALVGPILTQLALSATVLSVTIWRVHNPAPPAKIDNEVPIDDPAILRARRRTFPYYLIDPLKKRPPIEDSRNPMLVRELRWGILNRGTMLVRLFYGSLCVYFFGAATTLTLRARGTDIRPWIVVEIVMTLCVAPALLANAFPKERELSNIDMLRMTLLRGRDIVSGKLFSGAATLAPVVLAAVISILPLYAMAGLQDIDVVVAGYVTLVASTMLALSLSLLGSLIASRTSSAIAFSYGFVVLVFGGFYLGVSALTGWLVAHVPFAPPEFVLRAPAFTSPIAAFLEGVDYHTSGGYTVDYVFWGVNVAATITFSLLCVRFIGWYFERYRMVDR